MPAKQNQKIPTQDNASTKSANAFTQQYNPHTTAQETLRWRRKDT